MSHFRDRIILTPGNMPQLPSGRVLFNIGAYRLSPPTLTLDASVAAIAASTANATGSAFTATPTLALDAAIPAISQTVTSP